MDKKRRTMFFPSPAVKIDSLSSVMDGLMLPQYILQESSAAQIDSALRQLFDKDKDTLQFLDVKTKLLTYDSILSPDQTHVFRNEDRSELYVSTESMVQKSKKQKQKTKKRKKPKPFVFRLCNDIIHDDADDCLWRVYIIQKSQAPLVERKARVIIFKKAFPGAFDVIKAMSEKDCETIPGRKLQNGYIMPSLVEYQDLETWSTSVTFPVFEKNYEFILKSIRDQLNCLSKMNSEYVLADPSPRQIGITKRDDGSYVPYLLYPGLVRPLAKSNRGLIYLTSHSCFPNDNFKGFVALKTEEDKQYCKYFVLFELMRYMIKNVVNKEWSKEKQLDYISDDAGFLGLSMKVQHKLTNYYEGAVKSVAFSPNGERVASGSENNTVRIWDAATGKLQRELQGHGDSVTSVAFSPNGERVASGSDDRTVRIWDAATGQLQRELKGHSGVVASVAFSPSGAQVASGSRDKTIRIWDAVTGQLQRELKGHSGRVYSVVFSPNGKRVASGSNDRTVRIWDAATGQLQRELKGHSKSVWSVAFSPNGERVASGSSDNTVRIWDAATGQLQRELKGHSDSVYSVAFSPGGERVASGSFDKTVLIWNAVTGQIQRELEGHDELVTSVAFSPNGDRLASGSYDETLWIWSLPPDMIDEDLDILMKLQMLEEQRQERQERQVIKRDYVTEEEIDQEFLRQERKEIEKEREIAQ